MIDNLIVWIVITNYINWILLRFRICLLCLMMFLIIIGEFWMYGLVFVIGGIVRLSGLLLRVVVRGLRHDGVVVGFALFFIFYFWSLLYNIARI